VQTEVTQYFLLLQQLAVAVAVEMAWVFLAAQVVVGALGKLVVQALRVKELLAELETWGLEVTLTLLAVVVVEQLGLA
jgi:hypothetical protein